MQLISSKLRLMFWGLPHDSYPWMSKSAVKEKVLKSDCVFCHVTYGFQSESTLYRCLNVKEHLAQSRRETWSLSDCNWTRAQNQLVCKQTLNHLAKWLSVSLRTKWFWVRVQLQSLKVICYSGDRNLSKLNQIKNCFRNFFNSLIDMSRFFSIFFRNSRWQMFLKNRCS